MEARVGMTKVPDPASRNSPRFSSPPKVTHATVEYLDFPAISKEALRDPSYLASMRVADALAHVLRLFESDVVPHEKGSVDPIRDMEDVDIGAGAQRSGRGRKAHGASRQGPQEDQGSSARP